MNTIQQAEKNKQLIIKKKIVVKLEYVVSSKSNQKYLSITLPQNTDDTLTSISSSSMISE